MSPDAKALQVAERRPLEQWVGVESRRVVQQTCTCLGFSGMKSQQKRRRLLPRMRLSTQALLFCQPGC